MNDAIGSLVVDINNRSHTKDTAYSDLEDKQWRSKTKSRRRKKIKSYIYKYKPL